MLRLHEGQRVIAESQARFRVLNCGRRFGKTDYAKHRLIVSVRKTSLPYAYFSPTYKMLDEVFSQVVSQLHSVTARLRRQEKQIELIGGGVLDFWSLDAPDGARGRRYAGIVVDEAAMIPKLEYAWNEVIRPTLTDFSGWAEFLSTPRGRNFFWHLYRRGDDPAFPDWESWTFPSSGNPYMPADEFRAAQRELPQRSFEQEYMAAFLEDEGAVFRRVLDVATLQPQPPRDGESYVFGVDWGRHNDYTAIVIMEENSRRMIYLDRFNQIDWTLQRGRLETLARQYSPRLVLAESNSIGEPNIEELVKSGLPVRGFTTTASSKPGLINALSLAIEQQDVWLLDDPVLVNELQAYEMIRLPSGTFRYGAPEGGHDDTVIALALALHAASHSYGIVKRVPLKAAPTGQQEKDVTPLWQSFQR